MGLWWSRREEDSVTGGAEVLAELRQIRATLERLGERIGQAATREDLKNYVPMELFKHHLESHQKGIENWRTWLPWAVGTAIAIYEVVSRLGGG